MMKNKPIAISLNSSMTTQAQIFYPWLVWLLGATFFFYKYLVQVSPSVMTSDLMQAFQVNGAGLGNLSACYFYAYLLMQIPVGILLDRLSLRFLTSLAIVTCSLSTLLFAHTHSLSIACLMRAAMGFGAAFAAVSCLKAATLWFPARRFALVSGMCMTAAMFGAVGGQIPLSLLVQHLDWRSALDWVGGAGLLLSLLYVLIVQDRPQAYAQHSASSSILQQLKLIVRNKQAWLLSLYSGLAFTPVSVFGGLWGVPFLQEAYHVSASQAAFAVSWIFIGFAIGAPILGWFSDYWGRRKPVMVLGSCLALATLLMVLYLGSEQLWLLCLILFAFGMGASGFFTSFAMIREVFPAVLGATVLGFMNTFDSVCEAVSEPLAGALLDLTWKGQTSNGVHYFSTQGYHWALLMLPVYLCAALVILWWIEETYCQPYQE